jgi:hypothetical protein
VREEIDWSMAGNLRRNGIRVPERDRRRCGYQAAKKLNLDTAGWCILDTVKVYIEGEGYMGEYGARSRAARRRGGHYNSRLLPRNHRTWDINENDVLMVVIESQKDRYRGMTQINTYTGV